MWITNGPDAEVFCDLCKNRFGRRRKRITAFVVEREFGVTSGDKIDKLGMRGSNTSELIFRDVKVPAANVLGEVGGGVEVLMSGLDYERAVLAGGPLGIMRACLDVVVPYVRARKQFGRAIGEFQLIQGKIADMFTTANACRAYVYAVGRACDVADAAVAGESEDAARRRRRFAAKRRRRCDFIRR